MGPPGELLVLYGSVTGKAQSIAEQVVERLAARGREASLHCLGEVGKTWKLEEARTVVIVSSTTGDGEQPENVIKFWRKLRPKSLSSSFLAHLQYALLGLGDTNYNQFCAGPKQLHRRLQELGAATLLAPAWADDGTGLEEVVEPWMEQLWPALVMAAPGGLEGGMADLLITAPAAPDAEQPPALKLPPCPEPYLSVTYSPGPPSQCAQVPLPPLPSSAGPLLPATLTHCTLLTSRKAAKHYYEAELQLDTELAYRAGDTIAVVCPNAEQEVVSLRTRLGLEAVWEQEATVAVSPGTRKKKASVPAWLPQQASLDTLFRYHLDFRAVPKKPLIRSLVEHTSSPEDSLLLSRLCSREGGEEYLATVREKQLGLLCLLSLAPSCRPPVSLLLEHLPRLQPRPYSLSCSSLTSPRSLSFVFTLVTSPRPGLATSHLTSLPPGSQLHFYQRTNSFFLPPDSLDQSFMMVGAGSGLGPFLGFLQERRARLAAGEVGRGECWLLFGCREAGLDYIYRELLAELLEAGVITRLLVSFSQEGGEVRYVQDNMRRHGADLVDLVAEGARLYVCGDARGMARDVQNTLEQLYVRERGGSKEEGEQFVKDLRLQKQYLEDVWT